MSDNLISREARCQLELAECKAAYRQAASILELSRNAEKIFVYRTSRLVSIGDLMRFVRHFLEPYLQKVGGAFLENEPFDEKFISYTLTIRVGKRGG